MARPATIAEAWLWYASRTPVCAPLDEDAYPTDVIAGRRVLLPQWACRRPNGGVHKDNRVGRIDVHIAARPRARDEMSWTCDYQVRLIARRWLDQIQDLIDPAQTHLGSVFLNGQEQTDWATLHEASPPLLMMKEGWRTSCPICGGDDSAIYGGVFFADPAVLGRKVIVNGYGLFVRKEEAEARGLKTPAGAYKPLRVQYRPEWVSKMRWREPPVYASPG